ncbi:hypothetical protein C2E23DRAFT_887420 [Lenzites betulinus]|nr:hypothetical protein C2E23DRAFT_887420 [Lenzites betulinus]
MREKAELENRSSLNIASLRSSSHKLLEQLRPDGSSDDRNDEQMDIDWRDDDAANWVDLEEDTVEDNAIQIRDILALRPRGYCSKDESTWAHRIHNLDENWRPLIPRLVNAFLQW